MQDFEAMCAADLGRQITDELRLKRRESYIAGRNERSRWKITSTPTARLRLPRRVASK